ncbi:MAG TPA: SAM-dependent methyltransferase [Burkholderiales bacterium]|nr:SAM-dependent methyltransferase [Burkholderiales bacterium]
MKLEAALIAAACLAGAAPAHAVQPGQVSKTALFVCEHRAIAAQHPDPKLRNPDHLAGKLCGRVSQLPPDYAEARKFIDNIGVAYAPYFFVNARTLYIEAALRRAAAGGATQVVVLGSGFDSRAYRYRESHPQLRFFEVDLPPMIEEKKKRIAAVLGAVPDYVRYAPIDFDRQTLEEVLPALGFDATQKTFFILEGVTMYVREAGNAATLRFIARNSAPGSRVVYDYILRRVVRGKFDGMYGIAENSMAVAILDEPFVTGWTPGGAAAFAKRQGLKVVEDLGTKELTQRYLTGSDGKPDGRMPDGYRILQAQVP